MSPAPVDMRTDVVVVDANATVCALVASLLGESGLRVVCVPSLDALHLAPELTAEHAPVVLLDLSSDPAAAIDLPERLPAPLRRADRLVVTSVRPTLVASFCPPGSARPFAQLVERPFTPATLAEVLAPFFGDLGLRERLAPVRDEVPHAESWARLGERLLREHEQSVTIPASRSAALRAVTGSASSPLTGDVAGLVDMSDEAEVVLDVGTDELDAVELDDAAAAAAAASASAIAPAADLLDEPRVSARAAAIELAPIDLDDPDSAIISVDVSFDPYDESAVERIVDDASMTGSIEIVTEFDVDLDAIARRVALSAVPVTADAPAVAAMSQARLDERAHRDGVQTAEAPVIEDDELDDPHRAATRIAAAIELPAEETFDVGDEEIEELPEEFVVSMDRFDSDAHGVSAGEDDAGLTPPAPRHIAELEPAPLRPASLVGLAPRGLEGSAALMHLADVLRHIARRALHGVLRVVADGELSALVRVEGDCVRWVEVLHPDGTPCGLPAFLLATELVDPATLEALLTDDAGSLVDLPERLAERGVTSREAAHEALHWRAMQLLWELMRRPEAVYRLELEPPHEEQALFEARPALQVGVDAALIGFYRNFPEHAPAHLGSVRGAYLVTDQIVVHRFAGYGLLPEERWLLELLAEPRTLDGLLELTADHGQDTDRTQRVVARLLDFGMLVALPR